MFNFRKFTGKFTPFIAARSLCVWFCSPRNTCHNRKNTSCHSLREVVYSAAAAGHASGVRNATASQRKVNTRGERGRGQGERTAGRRRIEKAGLIPSHKSEQVESPEHRLSIQNGKSDRIKPHVNATSKTRGHWALQRKLLWRIALFLGNWTSLPRWK